MTEQNCQLVTTQPVMFVRYNLLWFKYDFYMDPWLRLSKRSEIYGPLRLANIVHHLKWVQWAIAYKLKKKLLFEVDCNWVKVELAWAPNKYIIKLDLSTIKLKHPFHVISENFFFFHSFCLLMVTYQKKFNRSLLKLIRHLQDQPLP
jgi:hypothetical protein